MKNFYVWILRENFGNYLQKGTIDQAISYELIINSFYYCSLAIDIHMINMIAYDI